VFFLPEPPKGFNTLRDFRRVAEQLSSEWSAALHAEYRRAHAQPNVLLELAELEDEAPARDWSWRFQMMTRLLQRLHDRSAGSAPPNAGRRPASQRDKRGQHPGAA
jgi:uncharacterized membrane protein YccC